MTHRSKAYRFRRDLTGPRRDVVVAREPNEPVMPHPEDPSHGALKRLDKRLDAFEAGRARPPVQAGSDGLGGMGSGYRFLGEVIGGVFVGTGLGWLIDKFAHTGPFGLIGGLLIGTGVSIWVAIRGAMRDASKFEATVDPQAEPGPADDDDE